MHGAASNNATRVAASSCRSFVSVNSVNDSIIGPVRRPTKLVVAEDDDDDSDVEEEEEEEDGMNCMEQLLMKHRCNVGGRRLN
jgi:hypothetical protein